MKEVFYMKINTENLVPLTEANQNFSKVAKLVDKNGSVIILKNNRPRCVIIEFSQYQAEQIASDENMECIVSHFLAKNYAIYEELAK